MKHIAIILVGLLLVAALASAAWGSFFPSARVYSVAEIQMGLQQDPQAWVGRTILVHSWSISGGSTGCPTPQGGPLPSASCRVTWIDLSPSYPNNGLPTFSVLLSHNEQSLTRPDLLTELGTSLHTLPVVGPTVFRWSGGQTLRVHLTTTPVTCTIRPSCPVGTLVQ